MDNDQDKIRILTERLKSLVAKHRSVTNELIELRKEVIALNTKKTSISEDTIEPKSNLSSELDKKKESQTLEHSSISGPSRSEEIVKNQTKKQSPEKREKRDLEKFIGENLISKIGIAVLVIGVGIGAKYAIDNDLINPLTRIVLGYLVGVLLLIVGIKLKTNYNDYSAVLVSGAIAIFYFITLFAYDFYSLIPQSVAFGLMVLFTIFAVIAAINYKKQIIAHLGLVGSYGIPFLLSSESGDPVTLFSYMIIVNIGILVIAIRNYWKPIYFSSFFLTWLIYFFWLSTDYIYNEDFRLAFIVATSFFLIFYLTYLSYKLINKEQFQKTDIALILVNSFVYFGIGYYLIQELPEGDQYLGLFTIGNAIIHFLVSTVIYRFRLVDRNLFFLVSGLVLIFITAAIPIQLKGNWITLLWAGEAALLFWIGRSRGMGFYEKLSYPLILLMVISLGMDWSAGYSLSEYSNTSDTINPIFNKVFLTSIVVIGALGFITFLMRNRKYIAPFKSKRDLLNIMTLLVPVLLILVTYFSFTAEISNYWNQNYYETAISLDSDNEFSKNYNFNLLSFRSVWLVNFTLLFLSILSFINIYKIKSKLLSIANLGFLVLAILGFLIGSLYEFSNVRDAYINATSDDFFTQGSINIWLRYVSYLFVALALFSFRKYALANIISYRLNIIFDILLTSVIIWVLSSELITWMEIGNSKQSDKLGLSILWGVYALVLIILGIWQKKKHLRIAAIVLFASTLIKLFAYDIVHLQTIAKTIVFVSLGVLLLLISFLYNKYKHLISGENEA